MKMISAAKYAQAEKALRPARVYGLAALGMKSLFISQLSYIIYNVIENFLLYLISSFQEDRNSS